MIQKGSIEGVLIQESGPKISDERGSFREIWYRDELEKALGYEWKHVQENQAISKKRVLRGIHIAPWNKLVHIAKGEVLAVVVDLRSESSTFKRHQSIKISEDNGLRLFIPGGCGNAYLVLSDEVVYEYQVDKYFNQAKEQGLTEQGLLWNDPDLAIDWSEENPILSEKDKNNPLFKDLFS